MAAKSAAAMDEVVGIAFSGNHDRYSITHCITTQRVRFTTEMHPCEPCTPMPPTAIPSSTFYADARLHARTHRCRSSPWWALSFSSVSSL